ncbi:MAG: DEAD/DEAH box helicase, partial [Planctomycetota bacterium]
MHQQKLFDDPVAWESSAPPQCVASIVFAQGPPGPFDYVAPAALRDARQPGTFLEAGRRVRVPFGRGNRTVVGYCVDVRSEAVDGAKLKAVASVVDGESLLSPAMLRLTRWMADHYLCSWGQVLEAVLPAGVRGRAGTRDVVLLSVPTRVAARLTQLDVTDKQRRVLEVLAGSAKPLAIKELAARSGCTTAPINTLRKAGLIDAHTERLDTGDLEPDTVERESPKRLNNDQQAALDTISDAIDSRRNETVLLHGVTGSGKTEVYIQAIEKVVGFGRQAIVLVPEISLTPQTVGRFLSRFDSVAVLHSHQSDVERHRAWGRIARGEASVVIGARSAVFAPTPHLGLIVIDEEHEATFKQDSTPRYHAREVALERARDERVPVVLASATPSLEAWRRTNHPSGPDGDDPKGGGWRLVSMPRRVSDRPLPAVRTVDLRDEAALRGG